MWLHSRHMIKKMCDHIVTRASILPAQRASNKMTTDHAYWTPQDETRFILFLSEHAAAAGDGGNFKMTTFEQAAAEVEPFRTKGAHRLKKGTLGRIFWFS